MAAELVHVGFGSVVNVDRAVGIMPPSSAPVKRLMQEGKSKRMLLDMTNGRRTRGVIIMDTGHIVLTAIAPETIVSRLASARAGRPAYAEALVE